MNFTNLSKNQSFCFISLFGLRVDIWIETCFILINQSCVDQSCHTLRQVVLEQSVARLMNI